MYGKLALFLLPIFFLGLIIPANGAIQFDNGIFGITNPFNITQNSTGIYYESNEGSYFFDGNSCSLTKYPGGAIHNNPQFTDSYQVMASNTSNGTTNWNPVSIINNAACSKFVTQTGNTVSFGGVKTVSGAGSFNVTYTKVPGQSLKITFSATNNNPAWTNYHIGLRETLSHVSQFITLGDSSVIDLSQNNNTGLGRSYISTHKAQLLKLDSRNSFDLGLGWNHLSTITDFYKVGNPSLIFDYTFNTPIISPGQTITIDPSITLDTLGTNASWGASTNATQTISVTVASHSHSILVVGLEDICNLVNYNANTCVYSSVKVGGTSFTKALNKTVSVSSAKGINTEIWYLINPPTGAIHITLTPVEKTGDGNGHTGGANVYSLYNVLTSSPIGNTNTNSTTSKGTVLSLTTTSHSSWIIDSLFAYDAGSASSLTNPSFTQGWNINQGSTYISASQYNSSPSLGASNKFTWQITSSKPWVEAAIQLLAFQTAPSVPTLTHANTLNSTAIKIDWTSVTNATWYQVNYTTPASGTFSQLVNQSGTSYTTNILAAGTQYAFKVQAGNSSGGSGFTPYKSNYTQQVAPTSPAISSITPTSARSSWTNPTGNVTGGFKIYTVTALGTNYTLTGTSSNSTNHFDLTGLQGNREYSVKIASRYAVGTNYSNTSSNSTIVTFYTLPSSPLSLTVTQTTPLHVLLSWTRPNDNGTVSGYFVERSLNNIAWSTLSANTGNSTTHYTDIVSTAGKYYYRVSAIQYAGTSSPSNIATITAYDTFTFRAYHHDGTTPVYGEAIQANATSSNNRFALVSGVTTINGLTNNNNFTAWNSLINFIVGKQYNYNATLNHSLNMTTNDYDIDCSSTGTGVDVEVWTNGTNGHRITTFTTPTCFANNTMKWSTKFTANGNDLNSYNTVVYVRAVNATFATVAPLKYNQTIVTTAFTNPYIVSNSVSVGTGLQTKLFNWSMNLTVSPAFTPVNFTVGHISVSGVNPVTAPIKFTTAVVNSSATAVTVTFPSTYTMGYQLTYGNEGTSQILTGLPVTSPSLGLGQSTITFRNPANDLVTIKAYDIVSNTTARYILAQPNNQIPFVTQILNFKNGLFGTSAMIGGIDIVSLIILLIAMIGLNRANEVVGAIMMIIIIGVAAYFGLIQWQTTMTAAIALVVLVIVSTQKKLFFS